MGWSLNFRPINEPELINRYLLSVGKALYIASSFESKCQYVLKIAKLAHYCHDNDDFSSFLEYGKSLKNKLLHDTLKELSTFPEIKQCDVETLNKSRTARNYIAHESANLNGLDYDNSSEICNLTERLRVELSILIVGDNIVSRWIYEIEETEPAPLDIQQRYPHLILNWIFNEQNT